MVRTSLLTYLALGLGSTAVLASKCGVATGSLQPVANFGENPTGLDLQIYVPKNLAPNPAVILAVRNLCSSSSSSIASKDEKSQNN